ncbi:hypothetical protein GOP47_0016179 [Adiantum capillus-veneris]|uniref:Uncharacterized protein n=1 Tax=Adiantum capillus-veneris TaxID=13818 RepID=A0A9D4ZBX2_ADICA|nr:hypothetical protein GOP47_0016179 [Adiantum capillus-veneris]
MRAWRSKPPAEEAEGHFFTKTATRKRRGEEEEREGEEELEEREELEEEEGKVSWFQEKGKRRRSPWKLADSAGYALVGKAPWQGDSIARMWRRRGSVQSTPEATAIASSRRRWREAMVFDTTSHSNCSMQWYIGVLE